MTDTELDEKQDIRKDRKKKRVILGVIIALAVLLATVGIFAGLYFHYYNKTTYVEDPSSIELSSEILETLPTMDPSEEAEIRKAMEQAKKEAEENPYNSRTYNLLLIGCDRRTKNWNGNSDTMILCTVNYTKKTLTLTSFMRDIAVTIGGVGINRLNSAFAVGGGPLLVETLKENFDIVVDNYAWVDFSTTDTIIDILGGIDLYLTKEEARRCGIDIEKAGMVHLNGLEAREHCRDRSSGGIDFQRTQRQRDVLMAVCQKAKNGSLGNLVEMANTILPYITHNIDSLKLASLILDLTTINEYELCEQRIPYDGMWSYSVNSYIVTDCHKAGELWKSYVY